MTNEDKPQIIRFRELSEIMFRKYSTCGNEPLISPL